MGPETAEYLDGSDLEAQIDNIQSLANRSNENDTTNSNTPPLNRTNLENAGLVLEHTHEAQPFNEDVAANEESIFVPAPGQSKIDLSNTKDLRSYANSCSICLSHFEMEEQVAWSSNTACTHVFHTECIQDWLMTAGYKHYKRQARMFRKGKTQAEPDQLQCILTAPMECPCCRQAFLSPNPELDAATLSTLDCLPDSLLAGTMPV